MSGRMILFIGAGREYEEFRRARGLSRREVQRISRPRELIGHRPEDVEVHIGRHADDETVDEAYRRGMMP